MVDGRVTMDGLTRRLLAAEERASAAEAALRESEARARLLMESWGQAVWETDADGVVVTDSASWRAYTGQTSEAWLGYGWLDAVHPDDRTFAERQWREAVATHRLVNAEFRLRAPDGGWRWTNVRATPVMDGRGNIEKWAGLNIDIDDRKRTEEALRASEEKYRGLFEDLGQGYAECELIRGADGRGVDVRYLALNPALERLSGGLLVADMIGRTAREVIPDIEDSHHALFQRIVDAGLPERVEYEVAALGRWYECYVYPIGGDRFISLYEDITERKRAEALLRESEERQAFLLKLSDALRTQTSPDAMAELALRLLADHLRADRVFLIDLRIDEDRLEIRVEWHRAGLDPVAGVYRLSDFPASLRIVREGTAVIEDCANDDALTDADKASIAALGVGAVIAAALRRGDRDVIFAIDLVSATPRSWTSGEVAIVEEVAERTWSAVEKARAEAALRASEARLAAAFESVPAGVAVVGLDGRTLLANDQYRGFLPGGVIPSRDGEARRSRWRAWDAAGRPIDPTDFPGARALRGERVVPALEMLFTNDAGQDVWTSVSTAPTRDARGELTGLVTVITDVDDLRRTADALRESEERHSFLLKLSDALRAEDTVDAVAALAPRLLADHLNLDRCYTAVWRLAEDRVDLIHQINRTDGPDVPSALRPSDFPDGLQRAISETMVVNDAALQSDLSFQDRQALLRIGLNAFVAASLHKGAENPIFVIMAASSRERNWSRGEVALIEEASERTWAAMERVRAEAALQESEGRFRQFAEASAFGLWIRRADTLVMEYVSPAVPVIYGVEPKVFHADLEQWAALIVPEDRAVALQHIERAREGKPAVHEFRIQRRSDHAFRWIRNTEFPLLDAQGHVERIGGIVEDVTEARLAVEHQGVLLAELQHRVRNIMAMIRSMALRSADGATHIEDYRSLLEGRLMALARVQVLLTREANAGGSLRGILEDEIGAQAHRADQFELDGPDIRLSPKAVEVLTLAFHELTTNALKYGALSVPEGRLRVDWAVFAKGGGTWLALDWREQGIPPRGPVTRRGFGSDLIEGRIPYELAGTGRIVIEPGGAHCHLEFPLKEGESVLETDAPVASTVFGGALDMAGAPDLTGRVVLVVEDDYYIAGDTAAALRGAGATVLGPCPSEDATLNLLKTDVPTHAVLDLNLGGGGPRFEIAHVLRSRGVPFVFLTGYDPDAIPADLADIPRLQKPTPFRTIVEAVAGLEP